MYNVTIEVGNGIEASFAVDMAAVKGEQGIQGVKGDTGKGFTILGTYATVEALAAAVTDAEQGDYYNVGTEAPYRIYMWDDAEGWQDQGQLQGPPGAQGEPGPSGPNMVTAETETTLTGLLKGDGTSVAAAEAGTDYVAPVEGKGLSTNDFTDAYKAKINQNATDIAAKQAKITVSGLLKGAGDGSISAAVSGTDYVAPVAGKGLSSNDFTDAYKEKIDQNATEIAAKQAKITANGVLQGDGEGNITSADPRDITADGFAPLLLCRGSDEIATSSDLNTEEFMHSGSYLCRNNDNAQSLRNCPTIVAFIMYVYCMTSNVDNLPAWATRVRKIINMNGEEFVQSASVGNTAGVYTWGQWKKISTTSVSTTALTMDDASRAMAIMSGEVD